MKATTFHTGDYIQSKEANKVYIVSQICSHHIIVQRIDNIKKIDDLGLSRKELCSIVPHKDVQKKFIIADQNNEFVKRAIETYEIDLIIGDESLEEMFSHF